jgi:hypothetical protein
MITGNRVKGQWWFRVFGVGVSGKDTRIHPLLFSERYGHRKGLRVGPWLFHFLPMHGKADDAPEKAEAAK